VPFERGRLEAVARRGGQVVARDAVMSAGEPAALRLAVDRRAGSGSLAWVTAEVVDSDGVVVPDADDLISWDVTGGGWIAGLDNGRQESPEGFKGTAHTAFNGKALAIVHTGAGDARVTASAPGLGTDSVSVAPARRPVPGPARPPAQTPPPFVEPPADASYSGREETIPAAMLDGDPATAWSNFYVAEATALLPNISLAHEREWVSVRWPAARPVDTVTATFVVDEAHALPAAIEVRSWDGSRWVPVTGLHVERGAPTRITFDRVRTTMLRLDLTSAAPRTDHGFVGIAELSPGG